MARVRSVLLAAGAALALVGVGVTPAFAAQSPTPADCASRPPGNPCIVITGSSDAAQVATGGTVHFTFDAVNDGGGSDPYGFTIDTDLSLDTDSVEVDGTHVTTRSDGQLAGDFAMPAGTHRSITFTATLKDDGPIPSVTTVSADGGVVSNDVTTSPFAVDLALTEVPTGPAHGNPRTGIELDVTAFNNGTDTVRARATFPLPAGWTARVRSGSDVTCAEAAGTVTCDKAQPLAGRPDGGTFYAPVVLTPPAAAPAGTTLKIPVHLEAVGRTDQHPSDNDATYTVVDDGTADLTATVSTTSDVVAVGGKIGVRVTVTNHGPDPATGLTVFVHPDGTFSGRKVVLSDPHGPGRIEEGSAGDDAPVEEAWEPGTVAAGKTVVLTLTLTGRAVGTVHIQVDTQESAGDPGATPFQDGRYESTQVQSGPVRVVAHLPASGGSSTASNSPIAATGVSGIGSTVGWAALLIALGAGLTVLGRTRYSARHTGR